jgi:uncharacterized protein GlcG (DUF336 family)
MDQHLRAGERLLVKPQQKNLFAALSSVLLASPIVTVGCLSSPVSAEPILRPAMPAQAALKAVTEAVNACKQLGYAVTATVVNSEGMVVAMWRGDGATPHTIENSFNKAYTAVSLGPIQKVDSTAKIYDSMKMNPGFGTWPLPAAPIKGFTFNPGGLVLSSGGELVGGLGVSGAPKGVIDESCAFSGRNAAKLLM